jgi:hypothetical protein
MSALWHVPIGLRAQLYPARSEDMPRNAIEPCSDRLEAFLVTRTLSLDPNLKPTT